MCICFDLNPTVKDKFKVHLMILIATEFCDHIALSFMNLMELEPFYVCEWIWTDQSRSTSLSLVLIWFCCFVQYIDMTPFSEIAAGISMPLWQFSSLILQQVSKQKLGLYRSFKLLSDPKVPVFRFGYLQLSA